MSIHPLAGQPVPVFMLTDIRNLTDSYHDLQPDPENPSEVISFGTSGHRGSSINRSFNEAHVMAVSQAVCEYRQAAGIHGPLFIGKDTHALSDAASRTAIEVLAANDVEVRYEDGYTPTPVVSHAILVHNQDHPEALADGIIITPSHNPPEDGGFKYNPPSGGPAGTAVTSAIETRANEILSSGNAAVMRRPFRKAVSLSNVREFDFLSPYVEALGTVLDMEAISEAGLRLGADPMGGAGVGYWAPIADRYRLDLTVVNERVDPTFSFMRIDRDGKIRMDCSSQYAMAGLIELRDSFDLAFGNDPDFDRHGIVISSHGLLNPNHYLAVAILYLFSHRKEWPDDAAIGKTLVSSSMIDRVADSLGRRLFEVPVGFKWFVDGLLDGSCGFGGEESAGASFLRLDGSTWSTDKDGIIMNLLAAEIMAVTGRDPGELYVKLTEQFGSPVYERTDIPADRKQKAVLRNLGAEDVTGDLLAGEPVLTKTTRAPGNDAPIGGLKVASKNGWFAARPSGTEDVYKVYAESFLGRDHLNTIQDEAREMIDRVFRAAES